MTIKWDHYKDEIIALHAEGKTLEDIRKTISARYPTAGFNPSTRSWRARLKEWGCTTYQREAPSSQVHSGRRGAEHRTTLENEPRSEHYPQTTDVAMSDAEIEIVDDLSSTSMSRSSGITVTTSEAIAMGANNHGQVSSRFSRAAAVATDDVVDTSEPELRPTAPSSPEAMLPIACARPSVNEPDYELIGQDVDKIDESFPLHSALQQGSEDMVRGLISADTNINAQTREGLTPLHIAVRAGASPSCIDSLLSHGADISIADAQGNLPLHWAISWNWVVAKMLFGKTFDAGDTSNRSHISPWQYALMTYRQGACTLNQLEIVWNGTHVKRLLYGGESPRSHLLGSLCHHHDTSTIRGRTTWWESMLSIVYAAQPLNLLGKMSISFIFDEKHITTFPNSEVTLLESLLREMPDIAISDSRRSQLFDLGDSLFRDEIEFYWRLGRSKNRFDDIFNLLLEGGCSNFWREYPERIMWWMGHLFRLGCRKHPCLCDDFHVASAMCKYSGNSLLMKAIQSVFFEDGREGIHVASFFIAHGSDAFRKEVDGQVPLLAAADKGFYRLVELILEEDLKKKGYQRRAHERASGRQDDRFYWPEWEEAKMTENWFHAIVLVEPVRSNFKSGMSDIGQSVLGGEAMGVLLRKAGTELSSTIQRTDRLARRTQVVEMIKICQKYGVQARDRTYEELIRLCE